MAGWDRLASVWRSRSNRSTSASDSRPGLMILIAAIDRPHPAAADPADDPVSADPLGRRLLVQLFGGGAGAQACAAIGAQHGVNPAQQVGSAIRLGGKPGVPLALRHVERSLEQRDRVALELNVSHRLFDGQARR